MYTFGKCRKNMRPWARIIHILLNERQIKLEINILEFEWHFKDTKPFELFLISIYFEFYRMSFEVKWFSIFFLQFFSNDIKYCVPLVSLTFTVVYQFSSLQARTLILQRNRILFLKPRTCSRSISYFSIKKKLLGWWNRKVRIWIGSVSDDIAGCR